MEATKEVAEVKTQGKRREWFDGKTILDRFYREHLHSTGLSKSVFVYELARHCSDRRSVKECFEEVFAQALV